MSLSLPAMLIASTAFSAFSQIQQGKAQADIYEAQAKREEAAQHIRSIERKEEMKRAIAQQRAKFGASGVTAEGTPNKLFEFTAGEFGKEQADDQAQTNASVSDAKANASMSRKAGFTGAVSTIFDVAAAEMRRG